MKTNRYLCSIGGKRYDALMKCIRINDKFTVRDVDIHPCTLKSLADRGLIDVVEKRSTYPVRPNVYRVPAYVVERFNDGG